MVSKKVKSVAVIFLCILSMCVVSCGDDTEFRVRGEVKGLGTRMISMMYVADGSIQMASAAAIDGKFDLRGDSKEYTVVEFFTGSNQLVGRLLAKNGDTFHCKFDMENPENIEVRGNKPSEQWSEFVKANGEMLKSGTPEMVDRLIAGYVTTHPDNIVSSLLMLTSYNSVDHESQADSLFSVIEPSARPEKLVEAYRLLLSENNTAALNAKVRAFTIHSLGDSMERFSPSRASYSLLCFSDAGIARNKERVALQRAFDCYPRRRFKLLDVSLAPDTVTWKAAAVDSLDWTQVWVPGSVCNSTFAALGIPRLPYYILSDSVGNQIYRGGVAAAALDSLDRRLKKRK